VEKEGRALLEWIFQHQAFSPEDVCVDCGMCSSQQEEEDKKWDMPEEVLNGLEDKLQKKPWQMSPVQPLTMEQNAKQSGLCGSCLTLVGLVEDALKDHQTEEEILEMLEKICAYTPFPQQCKWMAENYLSQLVEMLEAAEPPQKICTQLGFCTALPKYLAFSSS
jgi:hypothetical protein